MKDLFPRYRAMLGERVLRKAGWDTHGLPVEVEVEKELRIHGKAAIEEYGVEPFVSRCIESVSSVTPRSGNASRTASRFWVSLEDAYVTYHRSFVESVWWALSELFKKGCSTRGTRWSGGGRRAAPRSRRVRWARATRPSTIRACTSRSRSSSGPTLRSSSGRPPPWTLPSNGYAAVRPDTRYDVVTLGAALESKKGKPAEIELATPKLIVAR